MRIQRSHCPVLPPHGPAGIASSSLPVPGAPVLTRHSRTDPGVVPPPLASFFPRPGTTARPATVREGREMLLQPYAIRRLLLRHRDPAAYGQEWRRRYWAATSRPSGSDDVRDG